MQSDFEYMRNSVVNRCNLHFYLTHQWLWYFYHICIHHCIYCLHSSFSWCSCENEKFIWFLCRLLIGLDFGLILFLALFIINTSNDQQFSGKYINITRFILLFFRFIFFFILSFLFFLQNINVTIWHADPWMRKYLFFFCVCNRSNKNEKNRKKKK